MAPPIAAFRLISLVSQRLCSASSSAQKLTAWRPATRAHCGWFRQVRPLHQGAELLEDFATRPRCCQCGGPEPDGFRPSLQVRRCLKLLVRSSDCAARSGSDHEPNRLVHCCVFAAMTRRTFGGPSHVLATHCAAGRASCEERAHLLALGVRAVWIRDDGSMGLCYVRTASRRNPCRTRGEVACGRDFSGSRPDAFARTARSCECVSIA